MGIRLRQLTVSVLWDGSHPDSVHCSEIRQSHGFAKPCDCRVCIQVHRKGRKCLSCGHSKLGTVCQQPYSTGVQHRGHTPGYGAVTVRMHEGASVAARTCHICVWMSAPANSRLALLANDTANAEW